MFDKSLSVTRVAIVNEVKIGVVLNLRKLELQRYMAVSGHGERTRGGGRIKEHYK